MAEREPKLQYQDPERLKSLRGLVVDLLVEMRGREDPISMRNTDYLQGTVAALNVALGETNSIKLPDGEVYGIAQTGDNEHVKV